MRLRLLPVAAPVLALGLAITGCGGGGSKATAATSTTSTTAAGNAGFQAYRDCLKQHGVDLPANAGGGGGRRGPNATSGTSGPSGDSSPSGPSGDSGPSGGSGRTSRTLPPGVDQQTFDAANQACASLRPQGGAGGGGVRNNPAYLSCLADHGVTTTTAAPGAQPGRPFDRNDPKFQDANKTCQALLPSTTTTTAQS